MDLEGDGHYLLGSTIEEHRWLYGRKARKHVRKFNHQVKISIRDCPDKKRWC
jgi:hypothetical protein